MAYLHQIDTHGCHLTSLRLLETFLEKPTGLEKDNAL